VVGRVAVVVVGVAVLSAGCDAGSDDAEKGGRRPPSENGPSPSESVEEACRGVYERLPPATREATTEDEFIEHCLAIVRGTPDPVLMPPS
jgi:hypothetical protein